jgi:hypothetical protein
MTQTSKQPQNHKFSKGELVRWFERYADGLAIKDVGVGIVVDIKKYSYKSLNGRVYEYANFEVYRNNFNDIITLSEHDLESL